MPGGSGPGYGHKHYVNVDKCGFVAEGYYLGDATNNRQITGLGFTPKVVIIMGQDATNNYQTAIHTSNMANYDVVYVTVASALLTNQVKCIDDGFEVNNNEPSDFPNQLNKNYYWVALG